MFYILAIFPIFCIGPQICLKKISEGVLVWLIYFVEINMEKQKLYRSIQNMKSQNEKLYISGKIDLLTLFNTTYFSNTNLQGWAIWPMQCIFFAPPYIFLFSHFFVCLKWSLAIFRKCHEV